MKTVISEIRTSPERIKKARKPNSERKSMIKKASSGNRAPGKGSIQIKLSKYDTDIPSEQVAILFKTFEKNEYQDINSASRLIATPKTANPKAPPHKKLRAITPVLNTLRNHYSRSQFGEKDQGRNILILSQG